ncbi:endothelial zinc finger protein induced by tumor necrosis factor alpha [Clupea harengus]|uniref:Endothelial zinc finger protein induced by tumor necrosis factor alpha n=1 Tax=Clupea harengus TaxID=7950 RepID=A0A6P3VJB7_CLUHA|nr:endothelial zinc finger protein induced by tumor necrosis factor alpha [Clupea harengus]
MDKDRLAASRGPCSWLEMHQFIGDLMASSTSAPSSSPGHQQGKDSNQQEALRSSWETAGHEALGLKAVPSSHVQSRHPHDKGTLVCGLQPLSLPVERSGQAGDEEAQQFQHSGCNCPGCPFSSSSSSSLILPTLKPRGLPSSSSHPQPTRQRQAKDLNPSSVSFGLALGLGLSLEEEPSHSSGSANPEPSQPQQQDKGTNTQSSAPATTGCPHPTQIPTFPCLCCHRGFQTCAQLLHHQQGAGAHLSHAHAHAHHHHFHHHHCPLTSCLPCPQLRPPPSSQSPPPFPCLSCQRTFSTCAQLLRHQQGHAQQEGLQPQQHPCMHCSASFSRPSQLLQHQRAQHASKAGGFLCAECGRAFNSHSNLRIHLNVHTGARPYSCPDCGKSFSQSGALKIHRRIHTGERPYTCAYCGRGFPHLAGVRAHQRTHTGEKPYCCPQCGKRFTQSGALKIHQRIHTGERPFVCSLCGKGFSNRSGIRFHHRTVHGIVPESSAEPRRGPAYQAPSSSAPGGRCPSPVGSLGSSSPFTEHHDPSTGTRTSPASTNTTASGQSSHSRLGVEPDSQSHSGAARGKSSSSGAGGTKPPGGRGAKVLMYACEDCGLRFADAPSRNRHQSLEHYGGDEGGRGAE